MKCKNCLKQDVCLFLSKSANFLGKKQALTENVDCCRFEDKSQWIKLPCKVGDKVYFITKYKKEDKDYIILEGYLTEYTKCKEETNDHFTIRFIEKSIVEINSCPYYIGKTVFLTKEEAQAELERLKERERE